VISKGTPGSELGRTIREARTAKGLSLRALEQLTGVPNAHLSQLETGRIEQPSMALLYTISQELDLDYTALLRLAGHVEAASPNNAAVAGVAFRGSEDLTPEEADEVLRFIELLKRRQG
jgi:HTH-type transcriptional regulator, competence development regulator